MEMTTDNTEQPATYELTMTRLFNATPDRVFRAWTDPEQLRKWFAPRPFTVPEAEVDLRPGGASRIVMRDPEGNDYPNTGVYLEVVENERLVSTDAYVNAWTPSAKPFMTIIITLTPRGDKTEAVYQVRHWSKDDLETHVKMGFHEGWGQCADQLAELLESEAGHQA